MCTNAEFTNEQSLLWPKIVHFASPDVFTGAQGTKQIGGFNRVDKIVDQRNKAGAIIWLATSVNTCLHAGARYWIIYICTHSPTDDHALVRNVPKSRPVTSHWARPGESAMHHCCLTFCVHSNGKDRQIRLETLYLIPFGGWFDESVSFGSGVDTEAHKWGGQRTSISYFWTTAIKRRQRIVFVQNNNHNKQTMESV